MFWGTFTFNLSEIKHFSFKTVDNKVIENDGNHQEMNNTISFEDSDVSTDMMTETACNSTRLPTLKPIYEPTHETTTKPTREPTVELTITVTLLVRGKSF